MEKSKVQLDAEIRSCFEFNKDAKAFHVTSDGQCFPDTSENAARQHAFRNKLSVIRAERKDYIKEAVKKEANPYAGKTAAELKAIIADRPEITLGKTSKVADLIALLVADDAAEEAQ